MALALRLVCDGLFGRPHAALPVVGAWLGGLWHRDPSSKSKRALDSMAASSNRARVS
jgi:hypothetical protein